MALDVEMRRKEETSANVGREERREGREGEEGGEGGRGGRGREREGEEGGGGRWNEEERIWISSTSYYRYIHVGGTLSSSYYTE